MSTMNNNNTVNQQNNIENLAKKLEVLKKAVLDERKKKNELENEMSKLKEENVIKQETIDKLKKEVLKLRENSNKAQFPSFITGFFDNNNNKTPSILKDEQPNIKEPSHKEGPDERDTKIKELQAEINELKEKVDFLEKEKSVLNVNMSEAIEEFNKNKQKIETEMNEYKTSKQNEINSIKYEHETKINSLNKQLVEQSLTVDEQNKSIQCMSELCKSFDLQKFNYEKEVSTTKKEVEEYKEQFDLKNNELNNALEDNKKILITLGDYKEENLRLTNEVKQYKFIIEELTPLSIHHVFKGVILPRNKEETKKKVEICFGKFKHSMWFKEEGFKEVVLVSNEIYNIWVDEKYTNRLWMKIYVNKTQRMFVCEFKTKEIKSIIDFYRRSVKEKKDNVDNAIIDASLGVYY